VGGQAVAGDGAQPAPEGAGALTLEVGQLPDEDRHDVLDDVLGLGAEARVAKQPAVDERPVQVVEAPPGRFVRRGAQALQQAGGRFHDGYPTSMIARDRITGRYPDGNGNQTPAPALTAVDGPRPVW
jgi:hypothetical protein